MEITTTMVRFRFPKKGMAKRTDKAQLFICKGEHKVKIWVPLSKIEVTSPDDDEYNEIVMPKWLYLKSELPLYSDAEEFMVTSQISQNQLEQ